MRYLSQHIRDSCKKGFTLPELLVAMSIFIVVTGISVTVFAQIVKSQNNILRQQKVQDESRFVMEKIMKELMNGTIDYAQYHNDYYSTTYTEYTALPTDDSHAPSICNDEIPDETDMSCLGRNLETTLNIIDADGIAQTKIQRNSADDTVEIRKFSSCLTSGEVTWVADSEYSSGFLALSPDSINITDLKFFIFPLKDPVKVFEEDDIQFQPTVVIRMTTEDETGNVTLDLQTSLSTRIYDEATWDTTVADC